MQEYFIVFDKGGNETIRMMVRTERCDRIEGLLGVAATMHPGQILAEMRKFSSSFSITTEDNDHITRDYTAAIEERFKKFFNGSNVRVKCWKNCVNLPPENDSGDFYFNVANRGWPGDPD